MATPAVKSDTSVTQRTQLDDQSDARFWTLTSPFPVADSRKEEAQSEITRWYLFVGAD